MIPAVFGSLSGNPAQRCIENIEHRASMRGGQVSEAQRHMVAHCLRMPGTSTTLRINRAGRDPVAPSTEGAEA